VREADREIRGKRYNVKTLHDNTRNLNDNNREKVLQLLVNCCFDSVLSRLIVHFLMLCLMAMELMSVLQRKGKQA